MQWMKLKWCLFVSHYTISTGPLSPCLLAQTTKHPPNHLSTPPQPPNIYPKTIICLVVEADEDNLAGLGPSCSVWEWRETVAGDCVGHLSCPVYSTQSGRSSLQSPRGFSDSSSPESRESRKTETHRAGVCTRGPRLSS